MESAQQNRLEKEFLSATKNESLRDMQRCLDRGLDIDSRVGNIGRRALFHAILEGHVNTVRFLVDKSVDVNLQDDGMTPLYIASLFRHFEIVEILLNAGANVNAISHYGCSSLSEASRCDGCIRIVELLLKSGANVHLKATTDGKTPLHCAIEASKMQVAELLIEYGASLTVHDNDGKTPLDLAPSEDAKALLRMYNKVVHENKQLRGELQTIKNFIFATELSNMDRASYDDNPRKRRKVEDTSK